MRSNLGTSFPLFHGKDLLRDCETFCVDLHLKETLVQGPGPRWGELLTIASEETIPLNETIFH